MVDRSHDYGRSVGGGMHWIERLVWGLLIVFVLWLCLEQKSELQRLEAESVQRDYKVVGSVMQVAILALEATNEVEELKSGKPEQPKDGKLKSVKPSTDGDN